jgi:hypothetical protein
VWKKSTGTRGRDEDFTQTFTTKNTRAYFCCEPLLLFLLSFHIGIVFRKMTAFPVTWLARWFFIFWHETGN